MIGLDTNILLRYILQDDPLQSPRAAHLLEVRSPDDDPFFISLITVAETVWVLNSFYESTRIQIGFVIQEILKADRFFVQNAREVYTAITAFESGQADFADALIAALGTWAGCTTTFTFDEKASRLPGFELLEA